MDIKFPIFIETISSHGSSAPVYHARLLFHSEIKASDEFLQRAISKLIQRTKKAFDPLGRQWLHADLEEVAYNPEMESCRLNLKLDLKNRLVRVKCFLVSLSIQGKKVAFSPALDDVWFDVPATDSMESRATNVYQNYFRKLQKEEGDELSDPQVLQLNGESWLSSISVDIRIDQIARDEERQKMLSLWSSEEMDGATELYRVGRCLDWLYPDDLQKALCRVESVDKLVQTFQNRLHRPMLLIGEHWVGKTAVIHESIRKHLDQHPRRNRNRENVWLLAPQRLISGMSYVGQWENRLLAIIREARKKDHILYFDDLPGLFQAGKTSNSSLSVAAVLKTEMLKSNLRILAEITPEGFDKLTELDRSFADLFQLLRIEPTSSQETLDIAIRVAMEQEQLHRCQFEIDAIPKAMQLQRQYNRAAAFPGKAVRFLSDIALKNSHSNVNKMNVIQDFSESYGISMQFLDDNARLPRAEIESQLMRYLVGQPAAIQACADVLSWTKAHLNDENKPLATMMFVGPTGVGKTECAKTLARTMFDSDERLLRFDLNEFKSAYSAARLVGTPDEPEGLLTSAIRRNPFAVILFDEIEKAHKDVFDMLLQVTGEGRLTDSLGRTSDFTNCILIMTSNLGVRESQNQLGFQDKEDAARSQTHRFVRAVQSFFRPEFFNRIDRIVPFETLSPQVIRGIAERLMEKVVSREGLVRRRCILHIDRDSLDRVARKGYHPQMGARSLKRAIENDFAQPLADRLAAIRNDVPTLIQIAGDDQDQYDIQLHPLENVELISHQFPGKLPQAVVDHAVQFLQRFRSENLGVRPEGEISGSGIAPELLAYMGLSEQAKVVEEKIGLLKEWIQVQSEAVSPPMIANTAPRVRRSQAISSHGPSYESIPVFLKDISAARDIKSFVDQALEQVAPNNKEVSASPVRQMIDELVNECCLLDCMKASQKLEFYFFFRSFKREGNADPVQNHQGPFFRAYRRMFRKELALECVHQRCILPGTGVIRLFRLRGIGACSLVARESGCHLHCDQSGALSLIQTGVVEFSESQAKEVFEMVDQSNGSPTPSLHGLSPEILSKIDAANRYEVLRMIDHDNRIIDFRTGRTTNLLDERGETLRDLILSGLPLPAELSVLQN